MNVCLKCGAAATPETRDTDEPMCWAHGGGEPPEVDGRHDWPRDRPNLAREFNDMTEALGLGRRMYE